MLRQPRREAQAKSACCVMSPLFLLVGGRKGARNDHAGASTLCTTQIQSTAAVKRAVPGTPPNCSTAQLPAAAVYFHAILVTICSGHMHAILHTITKIASKSCVLC